MKEILDGVDQHTENQKRFKLPTRTIAKIFVFRLIYGGSAYSYCFDPDFNWISKDPKYWQKVIDEFYEKYAGIKTQHDLWMQEATRTGQLLMPTGRFYKFEPFTDRGYTKWPRTQILNYPVQGLAHDLVSIARVSFRTRLDGPNFVDVRSVVKLVSTVHDSIIVDTPKENVERLCHLFNDVYRDIPANFERLFNCKFNLPLKNEISIGDNLYDMKSYVE